MKKEVEKLNIMGVHVSCFRNLDVSSFVKGIISGDKQVSIFTPNPEIVLKAYKDREYLNILNSATYLIPDGVGLKFAAWASGHRLLKYTGADLTNDILKVAELEAKEVLLFRWTGSLSSEDEISNAFLKKYPKLNYKILSCEREYELENSFTTEAQIVFVNYGAPFQERFIKKNLHKMPTVRLICGVGGSFDFLTAKLNRAPLIFRKLGFEWLWRLFKEPKRRLVRIKNAVVVFPLLFIKWKITEICKKRID